MEWRPTHRTRLLRWRHLWTDRHDISSGVGPAALCIILCNMVFVQFYFCLSVFCFFVLFFNFSISSNFKKEKGNLEKRQGKEGRRTWIFISSWYYFWKKTRQKRGPKKLFSVVVFFFVFFGRPGRRAGHAAALPRLQGFAVRLQLHLEARRRIPFPSRPIPTRHSHSNETKIKWKNQMKPLEIYWNHKMNFIGFHLFHGVSWLLW